MIWDMVVIIKKVKEGRYSTADNIRMGEFAKYIDDLVKMYRESFNYENADFKGTF